MGIQIGVREKWEMEVHKNKTGFNSTVLYMVKTVNSNDNVINLMIKQNP